MSGPREFESPNLSDANPPKPANQGDDGTVHMQAKRTSSPPATRMSMAATVPVEQRLRGYKTDGIGGTFMPDNGVQGAEDGGTEERYSVS